MPLVLQLSSFHRPRHVTVLTASINHIHIHFHIHIHSMSTSPITPVAANATASADLPPAVQCHWCSLPSSLVPLICHYLPLRQLLVWSTVNRLIRSVVCREPQPASQSTAVSVSGGACSSASAAGDCWLCVPAVALRWNDKSRVSPETVGSLEVDGEALRSVTENIRKALRAGATWYTIADTFAGVSLSPPVDGTDPGHPPPAQRQPSPAHTRYSLIPPLAALMRSLRYVRRVEYHTQPAPGSTAVLLTVLTVLPSFPQLRHLSLHGGRAHLMTTKQIGEAERDSLVQGIFGCLFSLPHLSSLQLDGHLPTKRSHPNGRLHWADFQFAGDVLSELLGQRLLHVSIDARFLGDWMRHQKREADERQAMAARAQPVAGRAQENRQTAAAAAAKDVKAPIGWSGWAPVPLLVPPHSTAPHPQYRAVQSLLLTSEGITVRRLVHLFPSLVLLDASISSQYGGADEPPFPRPSRGRKQVDTDSGTDCSSGDGSDASGDDGGCALRFLNTGVHIKRLPEMGLIAQLDFLHSLCLFVGPQGSGPEPLAPLAAIAQLTQLRELTLEVSGGSFRHGIYQLDSTQVFDLTWLNHLIHLHYLHIKAFRHISPHTPIPIHPTTPPTPPTRIHIPYNPFWYRHICSWQCGHCSGM